MISIYLDDGICFGDSFTATESASRAIQEDLLAAGLVVNQEKSQLIPRQAGKWLGYQIDLQLGIPKDRCDRLVESLQPWLNGERRIPAWKLASIVRQIISMGLVLGGIARLMTRVSYHLLDTRLSWRETLGLTEDACEELRFWYNNLLQFNGRELWYQPSIVRIVYSDAGDVAYGGYLVDIGAEIAHGLWTIQESKLSSTWRELEAVKRMLDGWSARLDHENVKWFTDNKNVEQIIHCGSRQKHLQGIALEIFNICVKCSIHLEVVWIPRELNEQADYLSKMVDPDDWYLNPTIFQQPWIDYGGHTLWIGLHPVRMHMQLPRFNSRYWNPGTEAVDTFTCNWVDELNWCCPPIFLIPRNLNMQRSVKPWRGTLITSMEVCGILAPTMP